MARASVLPSFSFVPARAVCLKEEIGEQEAQQTESCDDLDRNTFSRPALYTHTGGTCSNAFSRVLSYSICFPLPQPLIFNLSLELSDLSLGILELLRQGVLGHGSSRRDRSRGSFEGSGLICATSLASHTGRCLGW